MRRLVPFSLLLFLAVALFAQELVEKIEIIGNDRVSRETILYYLSSREGEYFNRDLLRKDFRVLWSTGFFANIRIEAEDGTRGKIVKMIVQENPIVKAIGYKTGKKVKENDVVNKLKEKDEYILPFSYFNPAKAQRIKRTIIDLLSEKGLQAATVDSEVSRKGKSEVEVLFKIDEGPRLRVGLVEFKGDAELPASLLRASMKENRKHGLLSWITGKDVYKQNKLADDTATIKKKLQENGYMEATVGEPRVEEITKKTILFKTQKMMKIVIPVKAGPRYAVGEVKIDGSKVLSAKHLRSLIKLRRGSVYSTKAREKAVESIGETYRDGGYLYIQVMPVESLDPSHKVVNVTFNVNEGDVAYLNRLEFRGNTYTKDKVIRREMLLREGDRFSFAIFKDSLLRVKQLGLVELEKDPDIKPNPNDPTQLDVTVNVKELQRNNIQFTAGYSGYEGTFIALSYETVNFMGAGENLNFTVQTGARVKNYSFGFTEPYFLDKPISLGFNIYSRYIVYPGLYNQKTNGVTFNAGTRLFGYWRANASYTVQYVDATVSDTATDAIYKSLYGVGHYYENSITPSIYRSTIDSPLTPSRGTLYLASLKFDGSFLGGDITMIMPDLRWTFYHPVLAHHIVGLNIEYQTVIPLWGSEIPFWERFYLGGERSIRGYEIYTIGPKDSKGTNVGGEKSLVFNAEYIVPVGGPLYMILFHDVGNSLGRYHKFVWKEMYSSSGIEARIFVPALRIPFRLIFAYNNRLINASDSHFAFRFAVGTTF